MPSFIKRKAKSGIVYDIIFRYNDENNFEKQKKLSGFQKKKDAENAYYEFMQSTALPQEKEVSLDYDVQIKLFIENLRAENKDSTLFEKIRVINLYMSCFKGKKIKDITSSDLYLFKDRILERKTKKGTTVTTKSSLKIISLCFNFFQWCSDRYNIQNPAEKIILPKAKRTKRKMAIMEQTEFDIWNNQIEDTLWKTFFMFLFYMGTRIGEANALSDADVKGKKEIYIYKSITRKNLDGSAWKIVSPKTEGSKRYIPVPKILLNQLQDLFYWKEENSIGKSFLFGGDKPLQENMYRRKLNFYLLKYSAPPMRIHDFRHSYVSMLLHLGISFPVTASLIGDSIEQVTNTYGHMYLSDKTKAVEIIDKIHENKPINGEQIFENLCLN